MSASSTSVQPAVKEPRDEQILEWISEAKEAVAAKENEIKQLAIDMKVDAGLLQIRLGNITELSENEQLAMLKFTELQELKTKKKRLYEMLKPTEVCYLLFPLTHLQ